MFQQGFMSPSLIIIERWYYHAYNDYDFLICKVLVEVTNSPRVSHDCISSQLYEVFKRLSAHCFWFSGVQLYCLGSLLLVSSTSFSGTGGSCSEQKKSLNPLTYPAPNGRETKLATSWWTQWRIQLKSQIFSSELVMSKTKYRANIELTFVRWPETQLKKKKN